MKKLMYFCCVVVFVILTVLAVINYQYEIVERIEMDKQTIQIARPEDITNEEFLHSIDEKLQSVHCDVMYRYADTSKGKDKYVYYRTYHTDDFLPGTAGMNNTYGDISVVFYPLAEACRNNQSYNTYMVLYRDVDTVVDAISELGYEVQVRPSELLSGKLQVIAFAVIPVLMFFASIVFYVLSVAREAVLKKIDGYGNFDLTIEFIRKSGIVFGFVGAVFFIGASIYGKLAGHVLLMTDYMSYVLKYMLIGCAVIFCGYLVSAIVFAGYKNVSQIKGRVSRKLIYAGSCVLKLFIMIFAVFFLAVSVQNLYKMYLTSQTLQNQKEIISGYYTVPIYANNRSIDGLEGNYLKLYQETEEKYHGVLVYSRFYYYDPESDSTIAEEYNQQFIIINENYLDINPVYDTAGILITARMLDRDRADLIIPISKQDEMEDVIENIETGYGCKLNILYYDDSNSVLYSYNSRALKNRYGIIESPFIIVGNDKFINEDFIFSYLTSESYFFRTEKKDPDAEVIPILEKLDLLDNSFGVSSIEDNFRMDMDSVKEGLVFYGLQAVFLFLSIMSFSIFNTKLYCSIYKKRISICLLEGYSVWHCLKGYLLTTGISYAITVATGMFLINSMIKVNPLIYVAVILIEGLIFYVFARKIVSENLNENIKGA